jgi:5'-3' exonuclease
MGRREEVVFAGRKRETQQICETLPCLHLSSEQNRPQDHAHIRALLSISVSRRYFEIERKTASVSREFFFKQLFKLVSFL